MTAPANIDRVAAGRLERDLEAILGSDEPRFGSAGGARRGLTWAAIALGLLGAGGAGLLVLRSASPSHAPGTVTPAPSPATIAATSRAPVDRRDASAADRVVSEPAGADRPVPSRARAAPPQPTATARARVADRRDARPDTGMIARPEIPAELPPSSSPVPDAPDPGSASGVESLPGTGGKPAEPAVAATAPAAPAMDRSSAGAPPASAPDASARVAKKKRELESLDAIRLLRRQ